MGQLQSKDSEELYQQCVKKLKTLTTHQQIRSIAWLCITANSDGFMEKQEWQLIYKLYNQELKLNINDILKMQRQLMSENQKKSFITA
jgi:hypothetical protein